MDMTWANTLAEGLVDAFWFLTKAAKEDPIFAGCCAFFVLALVFLFTRRKR